LNLISVKGGSYPFPPLNANLVPEQYFCLNNHVHQYTIPYLKYKVNTKMPSTISKPRRTEDGTQPKPTTEPRPMPTFVSTLKAEETDFPRGGGTSLTALEVKQTRDEGRREAEAEDRADVSFFVPGHESS
jgi:hypothetical protein